MTNPLRLMVIALFSCAAACGSGVSDQPPSGNPGKRVDPAASGAVAGTVRFDGLPPAPEAIRLSRDCVALGGPNPQSDAVLVSPDGGLKNAFVYVRDGLDASYTFDTPTAPVEIAQKGCIYTPRVLGVRVGQSIDVVNGDATLHNVHALPMVNQEFNKSQPIQNSHMSHVFTAPEVMVRFKCDVHAWMAAYVGVMTHPYFAVSDDAGRFTIPNLPPGTYTLEAWHEKFGRRTGTVTVTERQTQTVDFSFTAASK